ncbi:MAG TPA: hypothetical protein VFA41_08475 [Ktedonobacteraceae bacterium]|jgi:hypothetical protein|nr:hypothetical protein [Ktedonobacteraceae bacterium]
MYQKKVSGSSGFRSVGYATSFALLVGFVVIFFSSCSGTADQQPTTSTVRRVVKIEASLAREYHSIAALKRDSSLIIRAVVLSQKTVVTNQHQVWTVSTVSVERVLLGNVAVKTTLGIKQLGGTANGVQYVFDEFPLLSIGAHYWVFLTPSEEPGVFYPVGAYQGVFFIDTNNTVSALTTIPGGAGVQIHQLTESQFIRDTQAA